MKSGIPVFGLVVLLGCFISVAQAQTPEILAQPTNQVVSAGSAAAFSVAASGAGPLTYQWQFNGTNLPSGVITTVAGKGIAGYSGDGGAATNAEFRWPSGLALDASGNLFIVDEENSRIRKLATNGIITTVAGNGTSRYSGDGGAATNAGLPLPVGVAADASGSLFIADVVSDRVRKVATNGIITTIAGKGIAGYSGDGGAATNAELSSPDGLAVDASGNLFIADSVNNRIRKVATNGIISTVAGKGTYGYAGDGGAATNAEFEYAAGLAVDTSGNLFIVDADNFRIRKVATNGIISTVAGNGGLGHSGDGGPATKAQLAPWGVAVDASGNLFIGDELNNRVRKVGTDGVITTVAGSGTPGYSGDGGAATKAKLSNPLGVAVDASGNLFIGDSGNGRIRKVILQGQSPALVLDNVGVENAGAYDVVISGPSGSVTSSVVTLQVVFPPAIVTQPQSQAVRVGSNATLTVTATGDAPLAYQWYFDGAPLAGQTNAAWRLSAAAFTNAGSYNVVVTNLYGTVTSAAAVLYVGIPPGITTQPVSQTNLFNSTATLSVAVSGTAPLTYQWQFNGTNLPNRLLTTVAGNGTAGYSGNRGAAIDAELNFPYGVALDASGNLFIADQNNNRIRKLATNGIITTVAGNGTPGYSGDGQAAVNAELNAPLGVALDASGNLFIADWRNFRIRKVSTNGVITTAAGNGLAGYAGDGSAATNAELNFPAAVAVDASGNLFIVDAYNRVREVVATNGIITTVAGNGTQGDSGDGGPASGAELHGPRGLAVDASGNVYFADCLNQRIREVGTNGIIATVAGNGIQGYSGDGGAATNAELNFPAGVALDGSGNLFIADGGNDRIRQVGTNGIITTAAGNGIAGFSGDGGAATNASLYGPQGVAVDGSGNLFIADEYNQRIRKSALEGQSPVLVLNNVGGANAGSYDVVVSNPCGTVTSRVVTLQVLTPPALVVQPQSQAVALGSSATLSVSATGTAPLVCQWYFDAAPLESRTNTALLLSAAAFTNAGSYNVVLTNLYGSVTSALAVLTVGLPPAITTQPVSLTNFLNTTAAFSVAVSGTGPFSYQWQFDGASLSYGAISTVAGNAIAGYSGDGGAATEAELSAQCGVAVDASGNLFIADYYNNRVRKVDTHGIISTVAGIATGGYSGDGGPAASAELNFPAAVALDASGNLFIADYENERVRKVGTNGIITTVAGNGTPGYSGDGGAAANAQLDGPYGVALDASGNLFIADWRNFCIRKVDTNGIISTVAGNGIAGYAGDGSAATNAELYFPAGVALDAAGNLFIADYYNNRIREVGTNGVIATVAGNGTAGYAGDGVAAAAAELNLPAGVAVDASGNLFIADSANNRVREVDFNGIITTAAGNGKAGYTDGNGGTPTFAEFSSPAGVALDAAGNLFVADQNNHIVREVPFPGRNPALVLDVVGSNLGAYDLVVSSPYGSVTSSVATLQLAEPPALVTQPQSQWVVMGSNATVSVAATGTAPLYYQWYFDGVRLRGQNNAALLLGAASSSNAGSYNVVVTNLYGALTSALAIVNVGLPPAITQQPVSQTNLLNTTATFSVAATGTGPLAYQWQFNGANLPGGPTGPTLVLNNVGGTNAGAYDVVVSSPYGSVTSSLVTLQVPLSPALVTQPQSQTVVVGSSVTLSVAAAGSAPLYYQWYFDGTPLRGQTNTSLLLSAAGPAAAGSYYVVVTNPYGSVTSAVAVLSLRAAPSITMQPVSQAVLPNGTATFSVAVSGPGPFSYQWQFNGANLPNRFITTAAGNGTAGYSGDGGPAGAAELNDPFGVAVDGSGNLFIADAANSCIRKVGASGIISTVAGSGIAGYSGDGGPATAAQLWFPYGVAVDGSGNLFIPDWFSCRVRKAGTNGIITTVAGNGTPGYSGDGGAAAKAQLQYPYGVAVDAPGNLFIADSSNHRIRKVGTDGIITTVAGNGTRGYSGDGRAATSAELNFPAGVAVDASGILFIADEGNNCVRRVGTNGLITTAAGNGFPGDSGDGGAAASAELNLPYGVAVDATANLFVADSSNNVVREVGIDGMIATVAGNGTPGYSGDGGAPADGELNHPTGVAVDAAGNLFIADQNNNVIREVFIPGPTLVLNNVVAANAGAYDVVVSNPYGRVTSSVVTLALALPPLNALLVGRQAVQLQFQGTPGASYLLLTATDLSPPVDWRPVITNIAGPNGAWTFTDTNVPSTRTRFYRMSATGQ